MEFKPNQPPQLFKIRLDKTINRIITSNTTNLQSCDWLKVSYLSDKLGMHVSTLRRQCQKHLSMSPKEYLSRYRHNRAKILLNAGMKPSQVASRLGFSDHKVFSTCFKRLEGVSPRQLSPTLREDFTQDTHLSNNIGLSP